MSKAHEQISELIRKIDVIIEVLDARLPVSSSNHLLAQLYVQAVPAKFAFLYKRRKPLALDLQSTSSGKAAGQIKQLHARAPQS